VARMGEGRGVYRVLVGRFECKRPLGRPVRRWEDNITTNIKKMPLHMGWIYLTKNKVQWRVVFNRVMSFWVP